MQRLSSYVATAPNRPLPVEVEEKAKHLVLDTLACMVSGSLLGPGQMAISYIRNIRGSAKEACIAGTDLLVSAVDAALANGMLAHADETDDSHAGSFTHPACSVVPAALSMSERGACSGRKMLRAVALGYDVCCRSSYVLNATEFWEAGRSTHGFGGTFGAAATAGMLAGLNATQIRYLFSYAAQQASGVSCLVRDSEHIEKAFDLGGMPARNGVTAALMVANGFTGVEDVFSGERNFFFAYAPNPQPREMVRYLGRRYEIMNTNIKKWSVGSSIQAPLDSLLELIRTEGIKDKDIERLVIRVGERGAKIANNRAMPAINMQHLIAVMLRDGTLTFATAHNSARMKDPEILAIKKRIELVPSPELNDVRPRRQGIVEIIMRNGRMLSHRTYAVKGTADNPMTSTEVEEKAMDLLAPVLGKRRARVLINTVWKLERVKDMRILRRLLMK